MRARLYAISQRQLADRTITPGEADVMLAALATLAALCAGGDLYLVAKQAAAVLEQAGWNDPVGAPHTNREDARGDKEA